MDINRALSSKQAAAAILLAVALLLNAPLWADSLSDGFRQPPDSARPWVYWFWLNSNITREGITADLEAMQRVGIGGVLIMEVDQGAPRGPVAFMSPEWRALFKHVVAEAQRLGLEVNMNNDAGWNGSGGPWIKPEQSMQKVVFSETDVEGPKHFDGVLPQPQAIAGYYRDIAVQAFPAPGPYRIDRIQAKACYQSDYVGPSIPKDVAPEMAIDPARITDLTARMDKDGRLAWEVPAGTWTIVRFGHTSTGVENAPAPESGRGLECDKLSKEGIEANFAGMMGKLIEDVGPGAGKALIRTHIDSWENGAQNWTARMREEFRARRGYDLEPFLPAFTGRVVGSLEKSERFLWDLRQTISDLVLENYAGHLRTLARQHGMQLSIEAYGGPCDNAPYAGRSDEPMGEFWIGGSALSTCKEMAAAAHTYGKTIVGAESFTAGDQERWQDHPATIKALGDQAFCVGINRFVFHRYAMQPWLDRRPGMTMGPWGTHVERTQTWWELTPAWHRYLARCQWMLRQGHFVADICYLQPEAAPKGFMGHKQQGYDFDECSAEVVLTRMSVKDGRLMLPDGMSYRVLALPDVPTMTPGLLAKIKELIEAGALVLGPRPQKSPSLTDYPKCDDDVKQLADAMWGDCNGTTIKEHRLGQGRIVCGMTPESLLAQAGISPDFRGPARLNFIHRAVEGSDVYFVANPHPYDVRAACTFRVRGKRPELWHPDSGATEPAAIFETANDSTIVLLSLEASGSVFVVFRDMNPVNDSIVAVSKDGKPLFSTTDRPAVTITKALYGKLGEPQRTRDVRDKIQAKVDSGEYVLRVAELAQSGDPAQGQLKSLAVDYVYNDKPFSVRGDDSDSVHLTGDAPNIVIKKAIYGVPGDEKRTRDVTAKLQHLIDTGESTFEVARMAQGDDPAFLVVKTLSIDYVVDGKPATAKGIDADTLTLAPPPPPLEKTAKIQLNPAMEPLIEAWQPGRYELKLASGQTQVLEAPAAPLSLDLPGPWDLHFAPNWGAPDEVTLDTLLSWSEHPDPGVKYFSGTAAYSTKFSATAEMFGPHRRVYLDLGKVQVMAQVKLNGQDLGVFWHPPFHIDVTATAKPGENDLEVNVTNLWINRMIGDEQLPEDSDRNPDGTLKSWPQWLNEGKPSPTGRFTFTTWRLWKKDAPLQPSGLLGPVTLSSVEILNVKP